MNVPVAAKPFDYLVCALPRSGSTVFCDALEATGVAGKPRQYLLPRIVEIMSLEFGLPPGAPLGNFFSALRRETRTPNGVFGVKLMHAELCELAQALDPGSPALRAVARQMQDLRCVRVRRRDLVRQAISHSRAVQTGHWSSRKAARSAPAAAPVYDFASLHALVQAFARLETGWDELLAGAAPEPLTVYYEDFTDDRTQVTRQVLAWLGLEAPEPLFTRELRFTRQGDSINDDWAARYRDEAGGVPS